HSRPPGLKSPSDSLGPARDSIEVRRRKPRLEGVKYFRQLLTKSLGYCLTFRTGPGNEDFHERIVIHRPTRDRKSIGPVESYFSFRCQPPCTSLASLPAFLPFWMEVE